MAPCDQIAGLDGGFHLQALGIHDGEFAPGLGDGFAHFGKLLQRGDGGFVAEKILARAHDANAERSALVGDGGAGDQLDRLVVQDFVFALRQLDGAELLRKSAICWGSVA